MVAGVVAARVSTWHACWGRGSCGGMGWGWAAVGGGEACTAVGDLGLRLQNGWEDLASLCLGFLPGNTGVSLPGLGGFHDER